MSAFDQLFSRNQESSKPHDTIPLVEDLIIGQSDQATNFEISINAGFPQSILILNPNFESSISITIDKVPRPVSPVIIFFPFPEDRLWQACLDTIKCASLIPHHYHCLIVVADDEAQKNAYPQRHKMEYSIKEPIVIWVGPIIRCPSAPARSNLS